MITLKLFNAVIAKVSDAKLLVSEDGFIIEPNAMWAKKEILDYYQKEKLSGNDLNLTFHKSWAKIKNSSRLELLIEQIFHYASTYGSNFQDEIYIPDEVLNVPGLKLKYKVIRAYTPEEMQEKCLAILKSGIALTEETINELLTVLVSDLNYTFTGSEGIRNKEAIIKIADLYGVLPTNVMDFFRYIIYRATGQSLIIKNDEMIAAIKASNYNPVVQFNKFGLEELSSIFNRFKPLFLAFKPKCAKAINRISKLSKKHHKPLVSNPLNNVTHTLLTDNDVHWLDNATPFALFKAMSACHARLNGQFAFLYRIRNGKSWAAEKGVSFGTDPNHFNYEFLLDYLKNRFDLSDKKIFFPLNIQFALPTSEKMYVGNIPTGTKFFGKKLAVGIYWKNSWGARDLDLSGVNIGGKVGWNSSFNQGDGDLMFSGDITNAPSGAVEYLHAKNGLQEPTLVMNNVYAGDDTCDYKIIVGKGNKVNKDYMMDPNKLFVEVKCKSIQTQSVLGIFIPEGKQQSFVLLNFGAGHTRVSGYSKVSEIATNALYQQWKDSLSFNEIVRELGAVLVDTQEDAEHNFSLDNLEKDSFTKIFE